MHEKARKCTTQHDLLQSTFISDTEWVVANNELCERQTYVVCGLPVGEKINFRVVAVNIAGRSLPATMSQPVTIREIIGESGSDLSQRVHEHLNIGSYIIIEA